MKFAITNDHGAGRKILISHNEVELAWHSTKLFAKLMMQPEEIVFGTLNRYLASLPTGKQDAIFGSYVAAYQIIEDPKLGSTREQVISDWARGFYKLVDVNHIKAWLADNGETVYNEQIQNSYVPDQGARETTYLRHEYDELVELMLLVKMTMHVMSSFAQYLHEVNSKFPESRVLDCLSGSKVCEHPAYKRLEAYCTFKAEELTAKPSNIASSVLDSLCSVEVPRHFLARTLVRSLSMGSNQNPQRTLVQGLYRSLHTESKSLASGTVEKPRTRDGDGNMECVAGRFRTTQDIPDYNYVTAGDYLKDITGVVKHVCPDGDVDKAKHYHHMISQSSDYTIAPYQTPLTALVLKRVIHMQDVNYINLESMYCAIAISAAWYSDKGFQEIANLMLSPYTKSNSDGYAGGYAFNGLTKENTDILAKLFPYLKRDKRGRAISNPCVVMTTQIIEQINELDYASAESIPLNIRNDLVTALKITQ